MCGHRDNYSAQPTTQGLDRDSSILRRGGHGVFVEKASFELLVTSIIKCFTSPMCNLIMEL